MASVDSRCPSLALNHPAKGGPWQARDPASPHVEAGEGDCGVQLSAANSEVEIESAFEALIADRCQPDHCLAKADHSYERRLHIGIRFDTHSLALIARRPGIPDRSCLKEGEYLSRLASLVSATPLT